MNKNKNKELLSILPPASREAIRQLSDTLQKHGFECYLVGDIVRDLLMNRKTGDIDCATDAHPEQVIPLFRRVIPTGIKHGTVTVLFGEIPVELTTFRSEAGYSDARHPDKINYAKTLSEDLMRRDFTVNAIAYNLVSSDIVDEHGGLEDIQSGIIRTIGNPIDRFFEDGLRPIRACRFTSTLGFEIEEKTFQSLMDPEVHRRVEKIAVERFTDEIWKGMRSASPGRMVLHLERTGLANIFLKYIKPAPANRNDLEFINTGNSSPAFRLAYWLYSLGIQNDTLFQTTKDLKMSNKDTRFIQWYQNYIKFNESVKDTFRLENKKLNEEELIRIRMFLSSLKQGLGKDTLEFLAGCSNHELFYFTSDDLINVFNSYPLVIGDLVIGGKELMDRGYRGKEVGKILGELLLHVLHHPSYNDKETLLKILDNHGT